MRRARFTATVSIRWCLAQLPGDAARHDLSALGDVLFETAGIAVAYRDGPFRAEAARLTLGPPVLGGAFD